MKQRLIKTASYDSERDLASILPSGSGINEEWQFKISGNNVIATNSWEYHSQSGSLVGEIPFTVTLGSDGSFTDPAFDEDGIIDSQLGTDIAVSLYEEDFDTPQQALDSLSEEDIEDGVLTVLDTIVDTVSVWFNNEVDENQLGECVRAYIAEVE